MQGLKLANEVSGMPIRNTAGILLTRNNKTTRRLHLMLLTIFFSVKKTCGKQREVKSQSCEK
jgi:hypothetical protein